MILAFPTTVTDIFERKLQKHISGAGKEAVFSTASAGWYIQLDGMISIHTGAEPAPFKVGDKLILNLRKA